MVVPFHQKCVTVAQTKDMASHEQLQALLTAHSFSHNSRPVRPEGIHIMTARRCCRHRRHSSCRRLLFLPHNESGTQKDTNVFETVIYTNH